MSRTNTGERSADIKKWTRDIVATVTMLGVAAVGTSCAANKGGSSTSSPEATMSQVVPPTEVSPSSSTPQGTQPDFYATSSPANTETPSLDPPEVLDPANNPDNLRTETYKYTTVTGETVSYDELVKHWSLTVDKYPTPQDAANGFAADMQEMLNMGCTSKDMEQAPFGRFSPDTDLSYGCPSVDGIFEVNGFKEATMGSSDAPIDPQAEKLLVEYNATLAGYNESITQQNMPQRVKSTVNLNGVTVAGNNVALSDPSYSAEVAMQLQIKDNAGSILPTVAEARLNGGLPKNFNNVITLQGSMHQKEGRWVFDKGLVTTYVAQQ